jgi:uncharacterized protein DUF1569
MKTTFDKTTRDALIDRINTLNENSTAQWGKMNVNQMLKHCTLWEEMLTGEIKCKRSFIGRVIGKTVLKGFLKDDRPMTRNAPSSPELIIKARHGDVASQKAKWIAMLEGHAHYPNNEFMHPFFGKMTKEQVGYLAYKHIDHHLRQFNS